MNRKEVSFGVDNVAVDAERFLVITEEQIEIFQRFAQKERLHHVSQLYLGHAFHVTQRTVTVFNSCKFLKALDNIIQLLDVPD